MADTELNILDELIPETDDLNEDEERALNAALHHVVRTSRAAVSAKKEGSESASPSPAQTAETSNKPANGVAAFKETVTSNPTFERVNKSLLMVSELLRNSYKQGAVDIEQIGFDQENLHELMRAVFSAAYGRVATDEEIVSFFDRWDEKSSSILFKDLYGFDEKSDQDAMTARLNFIVAKLEPLHDLLTYKKTSDVLSLLINYRKKSKQSERDEMLAAVKDIGKKFSQTEIRELMDKVQTDATAKVNPREFFIGNDTLPAYDPLRSLQRAFNTAPDEYQTAYQNRFYGDSLQAVVRRINQRFPEIPGMGRELKMAGKTGDNVTSMLSCIVENYDVRTPEQMKEKLDAIHRAIGSMYPNFLEAGDPVRAEIDEGAMKIYEAIWKTPETKAHFYPLYHIYNALKCTDDRYATEYKTQLFGGMERTDVMAEINKYFGEGVAERMQAATRSGDTSKTALIKFVAAVRNNSKYDEALKGDVIEVSKLLATIFTAISSK